MDLIAHEKEMHGHMTLKHVSLPHALLVYMSSDAFFFFRRTRLGKCARQLPDDLPLSVSRSRIGWSVVQTRCPTQLLA